MENREEIEKLLSCDDCKFATCEQCEISYNDKKKIREYIESLEAENYEQNNIINSYIEERQAVIDKLKEDIKESRKVLKQTHLKINKLYYKTKIEYAEELLKIYVGDNK